MEDLALAYTPHPNARRSAAPVVVGAGRSAGHSGGLAVMAAASLAVLSTAALLGAPGAAEGAISPLLAVSAVPAPIAPVEGQPRAFETREARDAAPLRSVTAESAPVETRASSPLPVAGDALGPVPEPQAVLAPVVAAREQHVLVGFDGHTTMTDGPAVQGAAPAAAQAPRQEYVPEHHGYVAPPPPVWNNPVQWIKVHKDGL